MEVDFTHYYIIVRHHCGATSLIAREHGEEHAQRAKRRFWDILSLRKERGSGLNLAGSASDHVQGDVNKVLGYFVTAKRVRFVPRSLKPMLVMVPDFKYKFNCAHAIYASWRNLFLNVNDASELYLTNYQCLYQEVDLIMLDPCGFYLDSGKLSLYDDLLTRGDLSCNKNVKDMESPYPLRRIDLSIMKS